MAVFDPQCLARLPSGLKWSPIAGCHDPLTAMVRAKGLAAGTGLAAGNVTDGNYWQGLTEDLVQTLLHAAALGGAGINDLYRWSLDPSAAKAAVNILRTNHDAAPGWDDLLEATVLADPRNRDNAWGGVRRAFAALALPQVRAAVDPGTAGAFEAETPDHAERVNEALDAMAKAVRPAMDVVLPFKAVR